MLEGSLLNLTLIDTEKSHAPELFDNLKGISSKILKSDKELLDCWKFILEY
jgi:hypothetical protein